MPIKYFFSPSEYRYENSIKGEFRVELLQIHCSQIQLIAMYVGDHRFYTNLQKPQYIDWHVFILLPSYGLFRVSDFSTFNCHIASPRYKP